MDARKRQRLIRVITLASKQPSFSEVIGIKTDIKKRIELGGQNEKLD